MALFVDLAALSNGLHGSVQMDSVALFLWIGWLRHHGILISFSILLFSSFPTFITHILYRNIYILSAINKKLLCFAVAFFTKLNNTGKQKRQLLKPRQDASQYTHHIKKQMPRIHLFLLSLH